MNARVSVVPPESCPGILRSLFSLLFSVGKGGMVSSPPSLDFDLRFFALLKMT